MSHGSQVDVGPGRPPAFGRRRSTMDGPCVIAPRYLGRAPPSPPAPTPTPEVGEHPGHQVGEVAGNQSLGGGRAGGLSMHVGGQRGGLERGAPPGRPTRRSSPTAHRRYLPWPAWRTRRPSRRTSAGTVGIGHRRGGPLQQRHRPRGRGPGGRRRCGRLRAAPIRRANSPSCGVSTTRERLSASRPPSSRPRAKRPSASTTTGTGESATSRATSAAVPSAGPARARPPPPRNARPPPARPWTTLPRARRRQPLRWPGARRAMHQELRDGPSPLPPDRRQRPRTRRHRSSLASRPPPARRPTTCCHLRAERDQPLHIGVLDNRDAGPGRTSPMSATAPGRPAGPSPWRARA